MTCSVSRLHEERRNGAQSLSQRLMPTAGAVLRIPGIDIHGVTAPLNGVEVRFADWQYRRDPTHVAFYSQATFRWLGQALDVDVSLDAEALGDGEYATLIDALRGHGYDQRDELRRFQLVRQVPVEDGGAPIDGHRGLPYAA